MYVYRKIQEVVIGNLVDIKEVQLGNIKRKLVKRMHCPSSEDYTQPVQLAQCYYSPIKNIGHKGYLLLYMVEE